MKNNQKCPKCNHPQILRIPGARGSYGSGNNIPNGMTVFSSILVTRYLCVSCGYSEEWIDNKEDIEKLIKKYS